jgi:hypothetical protein
MKHFFIFLFALFALSGQAQYTYSNNMEYHDSIITSSSLDTSSYTFSNIPHDRQVNVDLSLYDLKVTGRDSFTVYIQHKQNGSSTWTTVASQAFNGGSTTTITAYRISPFTYNGGYIRVYALAPSSTQHTWYGLRGSYCYPK